MKIQNKKAAKIFDVLKKSPKFQKYIKQKRENFLQKAEVSEPSLADVMKNKITKPAQSLAKKYATETMKHFYIPNYWLDSLAHYFLSGVLEMPTVPFITELTKDDNGYSQLSLHISKSVTIKDIKDNWPFIKKMQEMIPEIEASSIDDIQYAIYESKSAGNTNKEIIKILEQEHNQIIDSLQIDVIYSRMKKILG